MLERFRATELIRICLAHHKEVAPAGISFLPANTEFREGVMSNKPSLETITLYVRPLSRN